MYAENGSSSTSPHHEERLPNRFSLFSLPSVEFAQHLTSHDAVSHINNKKTTNTSNAE